MTVTMNELAPTPGTGPALRTHTFATRSSLDTDPSPDRRRPRVILDCDPGHDDAAAIVVAAAYTDLLAITTVGGNAPLMQTTHNALLMTQLYHLDIPVAQGAADPLEGRAEHAPSIHGISGLDGPDHPPLTRTPVSTYGPDLLIEYTRQEEGLWIIATGPLTNVAIALQRDAGLAQRVAGISLMGGSATFGNWSPAAEFNIWVDPEAADAVFRCGAPIRMVGLNATHNVLVTEQHVADLVQHATPQAMFMAELYRFFRSTYLEAFGMPDAPLHDPCAVLAVSHPELFDLRPRHVAIECVGTLTRGMTVVDERGWEMGEDPNALVAYDPKSDEILSLVHAAATRARDDDPSNENQ
jgi:inosine-uridine nucleoside N-ribohydrolase